VRVRVTSLIQQLASGSTREPLSRKNQGDLLVFSREALETGERFVRRSQADDAVMPRVAVTQLPLNVTQRTRILVNGENHGARHVSHLELLTK
jgi:hypothetical protein